ncbi:MAG: 4-hydroxybenzoate octaprenyltransferase [Moraxellaceae bacterium]|nr:4-hydroxybenzoate octaprenyltransferase [Moraxellaceae bacterium]
MKLTLKEKIHAYIQLTRFDKPVGIELLLWATLWGVMLAGMGKSQAMGQVAGLPPLKVVIIFALGAIFMRAGGCAINDFADRKVDGHISRTKSRPLADGRLSAKEAVATFIVLSLLSASLLFLLPIKVFYWSLGAVALAFIYPFMKRYTHFPQVVLACAFAWSIPMGYVAVQGYTDIWCWLVFIAYMCWTVAYDTQYAMTDKEDDLKVGVKSTAILFERLFGEYDVMAIVALQACFVVIMGIVLYHYFQQTVIAIMPLILYSLIINMFIKQDKKCLTRDSQLCFEAFLDNVWVGRYMFLVIVISCLLVSYM